MTQHRSYQLVVCLAAIVLVFLACTGSNPMHDDPNTSAVLIGDINLNERVNEIADAVLFSNYFIRGSNVFSQDPMRQIAATDCNRDGIPLQVADLQYLVNLVVGDALPYNALHPDTVRLLNLNGHLSVNEPIGAAFVMVQGNVTPTFYFQGAEASVHFDGTHTRILVGPTDVGPAIHGTFLHVPGNISGVEFSTPAGAPVVIE